MPDEANVGMNGLIDLTGVTLQDLDRFADSRLGDALRYVLSPGTGAAEPMAGFNSVAQPRGEK